MVMISARQSSVLIPILLLTCSIVAVNTYAHVSSETKTTVHSTKHRLDILTAVGIADNAPDPCLPSLCYSQGYIQTMLFHTANVTRQGILLRTFSMFRVSVTTSLALTTATGR
jgi:hypothetical protein